MPQIVELFVEFLGEYRDRMGTSVIEISAPSFEKPGQVELYVGLDPQENAFSKDALELIYYGVYVCLVLSGRVQDHASPNNPPYPPNHCYFYMQTILKCNP